MSNITPFSMPFPIFRHQIDAISELNLALLKLIENLDNFYGPTSRLDDDLEKFQYSLILLSDYVFNESRPHTYEDTHRLAALLDNIIPCFKRLTTILLNGKRSDSYSLRRYLQAGFRDSTPTPQTQNLYHGTRNNVHLSLGSSFHQLAFKAVNNWVDQLMSDFIKLTCDDLIPRENDAPATDPANLHQQREDLIKILQGMIATAMKVVRQEQCNTSIQSLLRRSNAGLESVKGDANALPAGKSNASSAAILPTPHDTSIDNLQGQQDSHHSRLQLASTASDPDISSRAAIPNISLAPSDPNPPDYQTLDPNAPFPPYQSSAFLNLHHPSPPDPSYHYQTAQWHIANSNFPSAISHLELALPPLSPGPPQSPTTTTTTTTTTTPTRTQILLEIHQCCLQATPQRITRARHALKEVYTSPHTSPPTKRYEAAHELAKLYIPDGEDLGRAREYIVAAVEGRRGLLGGEHWETRESLGLLRELERGFGGSG